MSGSGYQGLDWLYPSSGYGKAWGEEDVVRGGAGFLEVVGGEEAGVVAGDIGMLEGVALVINLNYKKATLAVGRVEDITLDEEVLETAGLGFAGLTGCAVTEMAHPGVAGLSGALVVDPVIGPACNLHTCVDVVEVEKGAGEPDGDGVVAVERKEPDSGDAIGAFHISAEVELFEIAQAGEWREKDRVDTVHEKGDDGDIGIAMEGIDGYAIGEPVLERKRIVFPVKEEEVAPCHFKHIHVF